MLKLLMALCCASLATGCAGLKGTAPPSFPSIPPPPASAQVPCRPTPLPKAVDGSLPKSGAEGGIRNGDIDLADCEAKRRLLIESWPVNLKP